MSQLIRSVPSRFRLIAVGLDWSNRRVRKRVTQLFSTTAIAAGSLLVFVPLLWMISTSLKESGNVFSIPPDFIPRESVQVRIEGKKYILYDVTIDGQTRTLAKVRLHPERSEFFDPENPAQRYFVPASQAKLHKKVKIHWENYKELWNYSSTPFGIYMRNTFFYSLVSAFGSVMINSYVAFGFARLRAPGKNTLFILILATMMLPVYATLIPQYVMWAKRFPNLLDRFLGIDYTFIDTYWPLMLPAFFGSAYEIFLFRQFYMTIPRDYDEAARIDGASFFGIWWRIILPMAVPVLIAVAVIDIMFYWNDYLFPLIYLNSTDNLPLSVGLATFHQKYSINAPPPYNLIMAGAIISVLPLALIFFVLNRYLVQGVVVSGIKG